MDLNKDIYVKIIILKTNLISLQLEMDLSKELGRRIHWA